MQSILIFLRSIDSKVQQKIRSNHDVSENTLVQLKTIYTVTTLGIVFLMIFGVIVLFNGSLIHAILDFVASIILAVLLYFTWRNQSFNTTVNVGMSTIGGLFLYLFATGGIAGYDYLWSYTFPLISFYFLGSKKGIIFVFIYFILSIGIIVLNISNDFFNLYDSQMALIFIPSFTLVIVATWINEMYRENSQKKLIVAKKSAESSNKSKSMFLANMSHDIRTPMNGIIGMTKLVQNTTLTTEQKNYLNIIESSADGLLGLLNDILDFSKIEAGELLIEKNNFNIQVLLQNIISLMNFHTKEKGLELIVENDIKELPEYIIGDELRIRQILINLLGNAIKFTEEGSVTLNITSSEKTNNLVRLNFSVIDTGIGIPLEKQHRIFTSFSQVDESITRKFGGTGLGLAISKQLTELMGGELWFESETGRGTKFHLSIALEKGTAPNEDLFNTTTTEKKLDSLKILVAEDQEINRFIIRKILINDGHQILEAHNGNHALQLLATNDVDLILMDIQMPDLDGLTTTSILRAIEKGKDLSQYNLDNTLIKSLSERYLGQQKPIIAMTAHAMQKDKENCLAAGMNDYLTKPINAKNVREAIKRIVN